LLLLSAKICKIPAFGKNPTDLIFPIFNQIFTETLSQHIFDRLAGDASPQTLPASVAANNGRLLITKTLQKKSYKNILLPITYFLL
jgi:hypothetical protein